METALGFATAITLLTLAAFWFVRTGDPLTPSGLQSGLWGAICLAYLLLPHGMVELSVRTYLIILAGSVAFSLGSYLVDRPAKRPQVAIAANATGVFAFVRNIVFWIPLVVFPLFVRRAWDLAEYANFTDSMYVNLRLALSVEEVGGGRYGVLAYAVVVSFGSVMTELILSKRRFFEPRGWVALVFAIAYGVLSTGRTFFALLLAGICGILILSSRVKLGRIAPYGILLFLVIFFVQGQALGKLAIGSAGDAEPIAAALHTFGVYLLGGVAGFNVAGNSVDLFSMSGDNTFRSVFAVLNTVGFDVKVVPLVKEYVYVPEPTNVYSIFMPYAQDFGLVGSVLAMAPIGAAHALVRRKARGGDPRYVVTYSLMLYPLAMQFFQDQYMSLLTSWVLFGSIVFFTLKPPRSGQSLLHENRGFGRNVDKQGHALHHGR